ncbi:hypothetical protein BRC86_08935 [Halobacteriales archaeon QS_3_64_16]|nr:MAG: hypothetical protein BRC86_08935 [Halobacteriales archaeon QS_3_64_16]
MSRLDAFLKGWSFRSSTPEFEPGQEIAAFVTGRDGRGQVARIGDTILHLDTGDGNGGEDLLDTRVRLRIEDFDANDHTGRATVLERLGEGSF